MEPKNHIGFELRLAHNVLETIMKSNSEKEGLHLTQLQIWILHWIDDHRGEDIYQRDLELAFHTSRATISSTLQVMERNGLVTRIQVSHDARLKKIQLTQKSLDLCQRRKEHADEMEQKLRRGMTDEEVNELLRLLRIVRANLKQEVNTEEKS